MIGLFFSTMISLLAVGFIFCIVRIREDFSRQRPSMGVFGIVAAVAQIAAFACVALFCALLFS